MRTATIRTDHGDAATATTVAAALVPDNTDAMTTTTDGATVVTTVTRPDVGGLQATVDDYLVGLRVADRLAGDGSTDVHDTTRITDS